MTADVNTVVSILSKAGYRRIAMPMMVANIAFEFPAALTGTGHSQDLIIVADFSANAEVRVRQRIEALARALDVVQSRRPLTVVLTGPRPSQAMLDALTRICRVLLVGPSAGSDSALRDKLAVLLPLDIAGTGRTIADPHGELAERTQSLEDKRLVGDLVAASSHGSVRVEERLSEIIAQPFEELLDRP